jgi:MscS family membrane protein
MMQMIADWFSQAWTDRHLRVGFILVGTLLAALVARVLVGGWLRKLAARTKSDLDDRILDALQQPVFGTVLIGGMAWAIGQLPLQPDTHFFVVALVQTALVVIWTTALMRVGGLLLRLVSQRGDKPLLVQPRTVPLLDILLKVVVVGGAVYFAFLAWHIDVTGWLASAGIVGIAVGFAAKDTLANLFAGMFIVADAPYKIGDFVVLDGGHRGQVTHIGMRSTRILTRDDIEITVPNAVIANGKIINETGGPHALSRVRVTVEVAYGSDVDRVREVLLGCVHDVEHVVAEPEPRVRFREFGASGLRFQLLAWIEEPVLRGRVLDVLNTRVYKAFNRAGIEIPYAKQDVYVKELPAGCQPTLPQPQ